ncbi:peptidase M61 [Chitinophaga eiseniae]|uniref:Peptidase M61 n=1 Tax=Chitinophaga eiseniae TaxID=634771 RepID=A0A847SF66_9BACT|nr:peptidase M61 [Chitinophaga eiseniae]NLR78403.1 peptidase M61 [Chitinophaga eiseniae]
MKKIYLLLIYINIVVSALAQQSYQYKVDLTKAGKHSVLVTLRTPKMNKRDVSFCLPAIIPGTYQFSNFGRLVFDLKAYDSKGKELPVMHEEGANSWKISKALNLDSISYTVEDTWHQPKDLGIYPMGGTSIEAGENFSINAPGFFGYFENMENLAFQVEFIKPTGFYGSSALEAVNTSDSSDLFSVGSVHDLYDSPIMYCKPDTASVNLGRTTVLVSSYTTDGKKHAPALVAEMERLLTATQSYLGGKLPIKKYAFLYNFANRAPMQGALEHNYSSFYALGSMPESKMKSMIVSISAHEFFHIITPLSISSKEIREFNYQVPVLSKHLWLYEGTTEYDAHHLQELYGLTDYKQFFKALTKKIAESYNKYNDTLPFTVMSKEVATTYKNQYGNVYEKGALISACLDIYLLHLSGGRYGLGQLKHDLGIRYGRNTYFEDDSLFDQIAMLSFPEVKDFLNKYVAGSMRIPYTDFFAMAGVDYHTNLQRQVYSIGQPGIAVMAGKKVTIVGVSNLDDMGRKMGYKLMDEIVSVNGEPASGSDFYELIDRQREAWKEGDVLTMVVKRKNDAGEEELKTLTAPVSVKETITEAYRMKMMPDKDLTPLQRNVRKAWLSGI